MADRPFLQDIYKRDGACYARNDHCNGTCDRFHERLWNNKIFAHGLAGSYLLRVGAWSSLDHGAFLRTARCKGLSGCGGPDSLFHIATRFDVSGESVYEGLKVSSYQYKKPGRGARGFSVYHSTTILVGSLS